jgi:hypothetical protein
MWVRVKVGNLPLPLQSRLTRKPAENRNILERQNRVSAFAFVLKLINLCATSRSVGDQLTVRVKVKVWQSASQYLELGKR